MRHALHRLLTGSAAVLIAGAVVMALPAAPALAADPAVRLHFPDLTVVASSAKINPLYAWIDVPGDPGSPPAQIDQVTVSVDTAGVTGIATVEPTDEFELSDEQACSTTGTVITCTMPGPLVLQPGTNLVPLLALQVTGKPGAAQDASGKLAFTAQLDGAPAVTTGSTVTIGEGVDLAGFITKAISVAAGATVAPELRVANAGAKPVHGVQLVLLGWNSGLLKGPGFSNCTYGLLTICTFDDELATGTTYELSTPLQLQIPSDAAAGSRASAFGSWYTPSDFKELIDIGVEGSDGGIFGPKGTGPAVRLQPVAAKPAAGKKSLTAGQVDTNPDNNVLINEVVVTGGQEPDVAAVGATVAGTAGDKVATRVGFRNNGPGTLYHWTFDNTNPDTHVVVPPGVRAVQVDDRCFAMPAPADTDPEGDQEFLPGVPGATDYLCEADPGKTVAKASTLFNFTFQVRDDASDAPGQVLINENGLGDVLDSSGSDNTAKIAVNLSGGGGGGGDGGGLPVTGANAGLLGAAGGALLGAGVLGLLLARRRRTRFTA
jgi:hypothetical protein